MNDKYVGISFAFAVFSVLVAAAVLGGENLSPEVAEIDLSHHYHELFLSGENLNSLPKWIVGVTQEDGKQQVGYLNEMLGRHKKGIY